MNIARIKDKDLKSYGKLVESWPNRLNRYMVHVRFKGSDKTYTMSKNSVEDVDDQLVIDQWINEDKELLTIKRQTP